MSDYLLKAKVEQLNVLIKKEPAGYAYFFKVLKTPKLIAPLIEGGFFTKPLQPIRDGNYISFPFWPEMGYLVRVADQAQDDAVAALNKIGDTDNQQILNDFIRVLLKIDNGKAVQFTEKIAEFLDKPYPPDSDLVCELIIKLATDRFGKSLGLAESLLAVNPDPQVEKSKKNKTPLTFLEPQIKYQDYDYEEALKKITPVLSELSPIPTVKVFSNLLEKTINYKLVGYSEKVTDDESSWQDYSSMWRPDIANERHRYQDQPRQGLVSALRNSLTALLESSQSAEKKVEVLQNVAAKKYKVFGRIVEYVLRDYRENSSFKALYNDLNKKVQPITDKKMLELDLYEVKHEIGPKFEELSKLSDKEFVEAIASYKPDPSRPAPWRFDDTYEAAESVIKGDVKRFIKISDQLNKLNKRYVNALIGGADDKANELSAEEIVSVLKLGEAILQEPADSEDQYLGWARMSLSRLLHKVVGQKEDKSEYLPKENVEFLAGLFLSLLKDPDPTPEQEKKYGGDNMDAVTLSLNTVRGETLIGFVRFILWMRRSNSEEPLIDKAYVELSRHLDTKNDPSLAIRSVYGQMLPYLWVGKKAWAEKNLLKIFSDDEYGKTAWDSYVSFSQPFTDVLTLIQPVLERQIKHLAISQESEKRSRDAEEQFVHHLMIYYWNGHLDLSKGSPILTFFETAHIKYRVAALHFIGFQLRDHGSKLEDKIRQRLLELWQYRLETITKTPAIGSEELEEFGSWFSSDAFDSKWAIDNLLKVLQIAHNANPDFMVLQKLCAVAEQYPLEAIQCLKELIVGARERWSISSWAGEASIVIKAALNSDDAEAKKLAKEQVDTLIRRGYYHFRDVIK